jgi:hypothetical protein
MADEVDRLAECFQLRREPLLVGRHRAIEAVRDVRTEARRRQAQDVGPVQLGEQGLPDRGVLGGCR